MTSIICDRLIYAIPTYYTIVNANTGDDNNGEIRGNDRGYFNARPFRTIQAASAAINQARGINNYIGQIIIQSNVQVNGDLNLIPYLYIRSGDSNGSYNIGQINEINITGRLTLGRDTRLEGINIRAGSIRQNGVTCGSLVRFNGQNVRGNNKTDEHDTVFYEIIDGSLGLSNSTINAIDDTLIKLQNSNMTVQSCNVIGYGDKCFHLCNSKMDINKCTIDYKGDNFLTEDNSSSLISFTNIDIFGDEVIMNDIGNESYAEYRNSFINIKSKSVKDVSNKEDLVYIDDIFTGDAQGLLNKETSTYNGIYRSTLINSKSQHIIRDASEYKIGDEDKVLIFKNSNSLKVYLPGNTVDGRQITLKFINVKERVVCGNFHKSDVAKIKKLNILNLNYLDGVWYLI